MRVVDLRYFLMVALLLATPALAETVLQQGLTLDRAAAQRLKDDARAMIEAKDLAGFDQAIRAAHLADLAAKGDQNRQRALFAAFVSADPLVADFTAAWLAAEPTSAYAQIARSWHLHALGWAMRGNALRQYTYPVAMAEMDRLHDEGLALAQQARDAAPDMIAASDAVMLLGQTRGMAEQAEAELARIMDIAPNLGSMTRAAYALAPKWGGSTQALDRICEDHAGEVPDVPGYSATMCAVDVYLAADVSGPALGWINAQLQQLPEHPHLLRPRATMALLGLGSTAEQIAALTAYLPAGEYDDTIFLEAAQTLDRLNRESGAGSSDHYGTVSKGFVPWLTAELAANPADPGLLNAYIGVMAGPQADDAPPPSDKAALLRRSLTAAPYNAKVLYALALLEADLNSPERLQAASPIMANAIVYSNYKSEYLQGFINLYHYAYRHAAGSPVNQPAGTQTDEALAAFDAAVSCPLVRMLRVVTYVCETSEQGAGDCATAGTYSERYRPLWQDTDARGACMDERTAPLEDLAYAPVEPLP